MINRQHLAMTHVLELHMRQCQLRGLQGRQRGMQQTATVQSCLQLLLGIAEKQTTISNKT